MIAFLLLVGGTLFLSGASMCVAHAAKHDPRWVFGSIILTPVYYRNHWDDLQIAGLLQAAGLVMALTGALAMRFEPEVQGAQRQASGSVFSSFDAHNYSGFTDSSRALRLLAQQTPGNQVVGRVHGEPFHPDRIELIDGILRLSEGRGFVPDREIAIDLGADATGKERLKRLVGRQSENPPAVHVSWREADGQPATQTFAGGYRLDLLVQPMSRNKLSGYVQLTLPDRWESYIAGDLEVVTSHLRFRGDQVDRAFDHEDTVAYVAEEFVMTQYNADDVAGVTFSGMVMDPLEGRASATARVQLKDGRVGMHAVKLAKAEFGWSVLVADSTAATEAAGYKPVYNVLPAGGALAQVPRPARERSQPRAAAAAPVEEKVMSFADLGALSGQGAVVEYRDGRREKGVLRGISKDRLVVEALKGGGTVQFRVSEQELARLRLNDGSVVRMAGVEAGVGPSGIVSGPVAGEAQPVTVGGMDLTRFMNRTVRVVTKDGKVTTGVFRGVNRDRLVIATQVRGGNIDYTVPAAQLDAIDFATP